MEEMINMMYTCRRYFTIFQGLLMASLLTLNQEMTFPAMDYSAGSQRCQPSLLSEVLSCSTGTLALVCLYCAFSAECLHPPPSPLDAALNLHGKCSTSALIQALTCVPYVICSFHFLDLLNNLLCVSSSPEHYSLPANWLYCVLLLPERHCKILWSHEPCILIICIYNQWGMAPR